MRIILIVSAFIFSFAMQALANQLTISKFDVYSVNTSSRTITFTCNIAWNNSWKNSINHDAVWVFMKYSTDGGATWAHASMAGSGINPAGFTPPTNFDLVVPQDEKGFFIQRSDLSSGNVNAQNVRFVWDYAQDGLSDETAIAANTINKIFGIEMVYIPEGAYYAGDGNSSSTYHLKQGSGDNDPWYVQNENSLTTSNAASDSIYYVSSGAAGENNSGDVFTLTSSFPKGYQAFYQMKYELTEHQWVSFFNTLTYEQKLNRDITAATRGGKNSDNIVNRNTISWDATSATAKAQTSREDRPVTYIGWPDLLAYADWAGLRPMTELEFEKSIRGKDVAPIADEFAWGKTSSNQADPTEIYPDADEEGSEQIYDSTTNFNRNSLGWTSGDGRAAGAAVGQAGPLRVGIFAESSSNRETSGAGYYGTMELSGNVCEMIVTIGRAEGRQFLGTHGDGSLTSVASYQGNATNTDWPGIDANSSRGVTGTIGSGCRGGDFNSSSIRHFQASDRSFAAKDPDSLGYFQRYDVNLGLFQGGRLVRTAPY